MYLICKKSAKMIAEKFEIFKDNTYFAYDKYDGLIDVIDDNNKHCLFRQDQIEYFFLSIKETRQIKLEKLGKVYK